MISERSIAYGIAKACREQGAELAFTYVVDKLEEADLIIGTHALIQDGVDYNRLGLIIIDEQHRFGVGQRRILREKGDNPDVLMMTATPIPRTLAITAFGDMDVSIIDQMPA